jgi:hypothetical protein
MGCWLFTPAMGSDLQCFTPFSSVSSFIEVPGEEIPIIAIAIAVLLVRIDLKMLSKGWVMDVLVWLWRSAGHMLSGEVATAPGLESHTV